MALSSEISQFWKMSVYNLRDLTKHSKGTLEHGGSVIYEDECFLVINKPAYVPIHPSILHFEDTLSNGVKYYFESHHIHKKIRPVNRLDKDTSGLVIFAKNQYIQESLAKQMLSNNFKKEYIAILDGYIDSNIGTISANISRKTDSIVERE